MPKDMVSMFDGRVNPGIAPFWGLLQIQVRFKTGESGINKQLPLAPEVSVMKHSPYG